MGDILSQEEIDNLLKALTSGELDTSTMANPNEEKKIRNYDFTRPSKFGKEQLRTLEMIFDNYARLISSYLTGYLRTPMQIEVSNSEQLTYNEFTNTLSNPVILSIVNLAPLKGSIILEFSANIGYSIIDRILGGMGIGLQKMRDFSEIEKILLDRIVVQLLNFIPEPWETVIDLTPRLDKIETNSQFAQIISPNEMIALVTLSLKLGEIDGFMNFALPHLVLEPIMDKLNTKYWFGRSEHQDVYHYREQLESKLETTKVPVRAVLGQTFVTVDDFIGLQEGDIITLDSYINSDLEILVGDLHKFQGKPGISKGKNAIQVTSIIRKEE